MKEKYNPKDIESKWYQFWEKNNYFIPKFDSNSEKFCIQLPPPNVTGSLHMGHAFNQTIMDIFIRYHRMRGDNTCWIVGTDHAGIATQIVVERQLLKDGISRLDLGREKFTKKIWEWILNYGNNIKKQMRSIGSSVDWSKEYFTMDDKLSSVVNKVFVDLYNQGLIYRSKRLVNWDPILSTAISDLEIENVEQQGFMYYIAYPLLESKDNSVIVATTRPETLLGDVAVAVNPDDIRYKNLIGKELILPLTGGRTVPIIKDKYVDKDFGTGCVKITPAHDFNDYQIGKRANTNLINIFDFKAKILKHAQVFDYSGVQLDEISLPNNYIGLDRFDARGKIVEDLKANNFLVKIEKRKLFIPKGDRTGSVIEPMLTSQWFVSMDKVALNDPSNMSLSEKARYLVKSGQVKFIPENWINTFNHWMNNIQDWCVSRQLWWGHQIPAWYDDDGNIYVAYNEHEASRISGKSNLKREEDVLDTWFSSALVPFASLGWPDDTIELRSFLPSSLLVTGYEIIFFWISRMMMFTYHFTGKTPFKEVYIHGMVLDNHGKKMSKSEGNVIDPLDVIEGINLEDLLIKRTTGLRKPENEIKIKNDTIKNYPKGISAYGADALRFSMASYASLGRSINFDLKRCEGYRNFCNKLWNATRFILVNIENNNINLNNSFNYSYSFVDSWIISILQGLINNITQSLDNFRVDLAANFLYEFVWNEYCDWYLELSKVVFQQENNEDILMTTVNTLLVVLEVILILLHPFIPFITEELWHIVMKLLNNKKTDSLIVTNWPVSSLEKIDNNSLIKIENLKEIVNIIRNLRCNMNISPSEKIPLFINGNDIDESIFKYLIYLCKLESINFINNFSDFEEVPFAIFKNTRLILKIAIDNKKELLRLKKEQDRLLKSISKLQSKLENQNYVEKAPYNLVQKDKHELIRLNELLQELIKQLDKL